MKRKRFHVKKRPIVGDPEPLKTVDGYELTPAYGAYREHPSKCYYVVEHASGLSVSYGSTTPTLKKAKELAEHVAHLYGDDGDRLPDTDDAAVVAAVAEWVKSERGW